MKKSNSTNLAVNWDKIILYLGQRSVMHVKIWIKQVAGPQVCTRLSHASQDMGSLDPESLTAGKCGGSEDTV